jgi:lysyl endopeptidase
MKNLKCKLVFGMKKIWLLLVCICIVNATNAQTIESVLPHSFSDLELKTESNPVTLLRSFTQSELDSLDVSEAGQGLLPKFSRSIKTDLNLINSGQWTELQNGDRVWRIAIKAPKAKALIPFFNEFYLPKSATLHVYSPDRKEVIGAFTSLNNTSDGFFCAGILHGEEIIIEYYEPKEANKEGKLAIHELGYAYRWVNGIEDADRDFGGSGSCEVNVNCAEGNNFLDQKNSVVRILVQSNTGQGWCSGALINNARNDCTPYLLSAQHCSEGTSTAQFNQYVFYFNYEAAGCNNPSSEGSLANKFINGCARKADSNDGGGSTGSDFILLELNSAPNASWSPFYAGWNISNTGASSGVGIHHPGGDIKKISTFTQQATSTAWGTGTGSHWRIFWSATTNGHGVTEEGSSGSPIFNSNGEIVGTLTGGDSFCNSPNQPDQYGKFSYHWTSNGSTAARQLKPWLDPDNSGITSLSGVYSPCAATLSNDAGIQTIQQPAGIVCGATINPVVVLKNYGSNTLTSVTINYTINGALSTYNWSGSLNTFSSTVVNLPSVAGQAGNNVFIATTNNPNGSTDLNSANDSKTTNFTLSGIASNLNLYLKTDEYGSETTWEVKNSNNILLYSGGPYTDNNNGQIINTPLCLPNGCYTMFLYDDYGDGMNGNLTGEMTLSDVNTGTIYATLTNPGFGDAISFNFCTQASDISQLGNITHRIYPNPNNGQFVISTENTNDLKLRVYNAVGQLILQSEISDKLYAIDLTAQPTGVYYVQLLQNGSIATEKIIIQ